jgi:hypothetical protein
VTLLVREARVERNERRVRMTPPNPRNQSGYTRLWATRAPGSSKSTPVRPTDLPGPTVQPVGAAMVPIDIGRDLTVYYGRCCVRRQPPAGCAGSSNPNSWEGERNGTRDYPAAACVLCGLHRSVDTRDSEDTRPGGTRGQWMAIPVPTPLFGEMVQSPEGTHRHWEH